MRAQGEPTAPETGASQMITEASGAAEGHSRDSPLVRMLPQEDRPVPALPKGRSRRAEDQVGVRAEPTQAGLLGQIGLPKTSVRPTCEPGRTAIVRQTRLTGRGAGLGGSGAEGGPRGDPEQQLQG